MINSSASIAHSQNKRMTDLLEKITVEPPQQADACVIWLHGLGADGHDFEALLPHLGLASDHGIRFIFPHAPIRPITINGGMAMRGWYDIIDIDLREKEDEKGIRASAAAIEALIDEQRRKGIASERTILAGFSQGGAIALHTGLRHANRLAGIMALSTYLPCKASLVHEATAINKSIPIFAAHGLNDPLLPETLGAKSAEQLKKLGYLVDYHTYPMEHSVSPDEITDISIWLKQVLAKP